MPKRLELSWSHEERKIDDGLKICAFEPAAEQRVGSDGRGGYELDGREGPGIWIEPCSEPSKQRVL